MTDDYYGRLGVESGADAQQIKRAYYTLVKKHPPERFPEEYKSLRAAYNILSNSKKRAEYDRTRALPETVHRLYEQAQAIERTGRHPQAIEVYNQILALYPDLPQVQLSLARAYEEADKPGKALAIWEKLCAAEPESAEYCYELALSYAHRGWNKKAVVCYWRALDLDDGNVECWRALVSCLLNASHRAEAQRACDMALRAMEKHGAQSVELLVYAVMFKTHDGDSATAERYLERIVHVMRTGGYRSGNLEEAVESLLLIAKNADRLQYIPYIQAMSAMLPNIPDELRELLDQGAFTAKIAALEKEGISELIQKLLVLVHEDCDCGKCTASRAESESHILTNVSVLRPQLERLKTEYTDLYTLHAAFFDMALAGRDIKKQLFRRKKIMDKYGTVFTFDEFDDDDSDDTWNFEPDQPVRVEPKVGRNDPCPCGSGKKYKHCCGK